MKIKALVFTLTFAGLSLTTLAQTSRRTISGAVSDATGAVISARTVVITNAETSVSRSTVTNSEGFYRFDAVDLGHISLKFTAPASA